MKTNSVVVIKRQKEGKVSEKTVGLHIGEDKLSGDYLSYFQKLKHRKYKNKQMRCEK